MKRMGTDGFLGWEAIPLMIFAKRKLIQ